MLRVSLVAGIGGPAAAFGARPLPLAGLAHAVAQLGCAHDLHRHVPLRGQSVLITLWIRLCTSTIHGPTIKVHDDRHFIA